MVHGIIKKAGLKEKLLWILGQRKLFKIEGQSMEPILKHGNVVFMKPTRNVTPGNLAVCRHPIQSDLTIVKQVESIEGEKISLKSLNPSTSSDSRMFGLIDKERVLGYITSIR